MSFLYFFKFNQLKLNFELVKCLLLIYNTINFVETRVFVKNSISNLAHFKMYKGTN